MIVAAARSDRQLSPSSSSASSASSILRLGPSASEGSTRPILRGHPRAGSIGAGARGTGTEHVVDDGLSGALHRLALLHLAPLLTPRRLPDGRAREVTSMPRLRRRAPSSQSPSAPRRRPEAIGSMRANLDGCNRLSAAPGAAGVDRRSLGEPRPRPRSLAGSGLGSWSGGGRGARAPSPSPRRSS